MIIPGNHWQDPEAYRTKFTELSQAVGLTIKTAKNEDGSVAGFGGIELDTQRMVIQLPTKKISKVQNLIQNAIKAKSLSLVELQRITGYLNFLSIVLPLGRTFLRRLYNMQLYFPTQNTKCRRRILRDARKDLTWWLKVLNIQPERSIIRQARTLVSLWTDASGTKGLGAYYTIGQEEPLAGNSSSPNNPIFTQPIPGRAFSITLPRYITRTSEHINTKEMRAVEQALLHWGMKWEGMKVIIYTDNRAVSYGIANRTIRGGSMSVLRRCLLLAAEYDLEIDTLWIPTKNNALADALSRFNFDKIANLAPQLIYPTFSLRDHGFRTYSKQASLP